MSAELRKDSRKALVLPTWINPDQPLHLNGVTRRRIRRDFDLNRVFLNVPYSERYSSLELTKLVAILSKWIEETCSNKRLNRGTLMQSYRRLRRLRHQLGSDFEKLRPEELISLLSVSKDEIGLTLA